MRKWGLTSLGVVLAIGFVYYRTLARFEPLGELGPEVSDEARVGAEAELERAPVVPSPPSTAERAPLETPAPARRPALRGRVLTPDGQPYGWATVRFATVRRGRAELEQTLTLHDGRFELFPADPEAHGDLLVTASRHAYAPAARLDVTASDEELELRLAPPRQFALRLHDRDGLELVPAEVSFHWILAGVTREDEDESLGECRWALPPVPFRIHVNDPHVADGWLGPFDPAEVGDELGLEVRRRPFVRGRVLAAGTPVTGAEVRMEHGSPGGRVFPSPTRSDAHGEFWFRVDEPGTFRPVAFHAQHGFGESPEVTLTDDRDLVGLEIELSEPAGAIAGHVVLPADRSPSEISLQVDRRTRTLRADGSFLLPGLEPGAHALRAVRGDPSAPRDAWVSSSHRLLEELAQDVSLSVEVQPGLTTDVVLDLVVPPPVRLACRIELGMPVSDATTVGNYEARGVWLWTESLWSQALLRPEGTFSAGFAAPGLRRLRAELLLEPSLGSWTVTDEVHLDLGENRWDLALVPGSLRLVFDEECELLEQPDLHWSDGGARTIAVGTPISGLAASSPGALLYAVVPPGRVYFSLTADGTTFEALVRSGATTEFHFPASARDEVHAACDVRASGLQLPSYLMPVGAY